MEGREHTCPNDNGSSQNPIIECVSARAMNCSEILVLSLRYVFCFSDLMNSCMGFRHAMNTSSFIVGCAFRGLEAQN